MHAWRPYFMGSRGQFFCYCCIGMHHVRVVVANTERLHLHKIINGWWYRFGREFYTVGWVLSSTHYLVTGIATRTCRDVSRAVHLECVWEGRYNKQQATRKPHVFLFTSNKNLADKEEQHYGRYPLAHSVWTHGIVLRSICLLFNTTIILLQHCYHTTYCMYLAPIDTRLTAHCFSYRYISKYYNYLHSGALSPLS